MKKKNPIRISAILLIVFLMTVCTACEKVSSVSMRKLRSEKPQNSLDVTVLDGKTSVSMQNKNCLFVLDKETATFSVTNRTSGDTFLSTVSDASEDQVVTGKERTKMSSVLKISYLDEENEIIDTANTKADAFKNDEETGKSIANVKIVLGDDEVIVNYIFSALKIVIPIRFSLCDDGFICSVLTSRIVEHSHFRVMTVTLLPYFGAVKQTKNGYLFLPDGSGSIAYLNDGKASYETYSAPVYGNDYCFDLLTDSDKVQTVRLPVFGINRNSNGFLGIITEGDSLARIEAAAIGQISEYASVCATFTARSTYTYTMGESNGDSKPQTVYVYEKKDFSKNGDTSYSTGDFSVKYCLLDREHCDYCGMAQKYREYLVATMGIKGNKIEPALTIELPGAIQSVRKIFGCSVYSTHVLNGISDMEHIISEFGACGVNRINVKFTNWTKQQLKGQVQDQADVLSALGGAKTMKNFLKSSKKGIQLYLDSDRFSTKHRQLRYASGKFSARNVSGKVAQKYTYELENYLRNPKIAPVTLIAPAQMYEPLNRFLKSADCFDTAQMSLSETAELLSSDFTEIGWTREHSKREIMLSLQEINTKHALMVQGGNAYTLGTASVVTNAPDTDSSFNMTDRAVPFYQLSVSGLVSYSYQPLNSTKDTAWLFLKSIETGADLHLYFVSSNAEKMPDTAEYTKYASVAPGCWYKRVEDYYHQICALNKVTDGSRIIAHRALSDDVFETTWENGCKVITNYLTVPYVCDAGTVEPFGYLIIGEVTD